jgi:hypothetical protein
LDIHPKEFSHLQEIDLVLPGFSLQVPWQECKLARKFTAAAACDGSGWAFFDSVGFGNFWFLFFAV